MILNMAGGGGNALNFDVKAYDTEEALLAATPKENTIGIITGTPITGWVFSAVEPENPTEGLAWIVTGTSSGAEFNALRKNTIQVYPLSAKQYVSGTWESAAAKSYQSGDWADWWDGYMIKDGVALSEVTLQGMKYDASAADGSSNPAMTSSEGYLEIAGTKAGYCLACVSAKALIGNTLKIEGTFVPGTGINLAIWTSIGTYITSNMVASAALTETGASIDIGSLDRSWSYLVGITSVYTHKQKIKNLYIT
ncbi:MAG: hypothetical protein ACI4PH_01260 [Faecousia sp.]